LKVQKTKAFDEKKIQYLMIALIVTLLVDASLVKVYDIVEKTFIPLESKLLLFAANSTLCFVLQYFILSSLRSTLASVLPLKTVRHQLLYLISMGALFSLAFLVGILIIQQFYYHHYETLISILIIAISYGTGTVFLLWLSWLFLSWYRSKHSLIVLLYFVSVLVIGFNLIMTASYSIAKVTDRPHEIGVFVGGSGDFFNEKYLILDNVYRISSFMSFFSIWLTTAVLMNYYREKLVRAVVYWVILSIPLVYFLVTYFYQYILAKTLTSYVQIDPVLVSIILSAFLSLSKPIGGLIFALAFWNIAKAVSYERTIRAYMIISGWGIFLIFAANQATTQALTPYPPFGLATITVLNLASYLMFIGIYSAATLVSLNSNLRKTIYKNALESKLLHLIGHAEMEKEVEKTVSKIVRESTELNEEVPIELDQKELKRYLDFVLKEVKQTDKLS
jgi:hypothetical protein